jgi:hypothetical protein
MQADRLEPQGIEAMDRKQAAEIKKHILKAADSITRASNIIDALDGGDREVLTAPLLDIIVALHFKLLREVYSRYPDLRPPDPGRSMIDTVRRWEDIVLPGSVSETDLDSTIFSALTSRGQKTAMVLTRALERCKTLGLPVDLQVLGARIEALAEADRLECEGDPRKWRYSELRLKEEPREV